MAWARLRRANLRFMEGEEVLRYAVGRMVAQVNRCLYAMGAFTRGSELDATLGQFHFYSTTEAASKKQ